MASRSKSWALLRRFLLPRIGVSFLYWWRWAAKVSPRAEVEYSPNVRFGPKCVVSSFTKIKASRGPLVVGKRAGFATGCFISAGANGIHIGDNFICGPNVTISSNTYFYDEPDVHLEDLGVGSRGIRIGNNVWIGAGSVVLDGTVLGDNTVVVANSLVNRRYPGNSILQGNPARVIMKRFASKGEAGSNQPTGGAGNTESEQCAKELSTS